jgi:spermidine synthase
MPRRLVLGLFFIGGVSALIYEIAWVRQASLAFGVSLYAYSAVLAATMGGMAIGEYLMGHYADPSKRPLVLFSGLQILLAGLGALTLPALNGLTGLYSLVVRAIDATGPTLNVLRLGMAALALTLPAILIGAGFPLMSRIVARHHRVGEDVGWMMGINTLGSVLGCLLAAIVLIRFLGLSGTVLLAAALNLIVALVSWRLAGRERDPQTSPAAQPETAPAKEGASLPVSRPGAGLLSAWTLEFILWAYALSGFVALADEVVWARLIGVFVPGTVYSFAILLAVCLAGLAGGSLIATAWLRRRKATLHLFGALELAVGLLSVGALFSFASLPNLHLESLLQNDSAANGMVWAAVLALITLFPVTLGMGMLFPVVSSLYTAESSRQVGQHLGRLAAYNTTGSIVGALLAGFVSVPLLGMRSSALALGGISLLIGLAAVVVSGMGAGGAANGFRAAKFRLVPIVGGLVVVAVAILAAARLPVAHYLGAWQADASRLIFYKEGLESTVAVFSAGPEHPKFTTINGQTEVPTDEPGLRAFHLLGHLPPLLVPDARDALMLGFGNGISSGAMATHRIPVLDVVELAPEMVAAAQAVYSVENRLVLQDPVLTIDSDDARNYLLQTSHKYDIITADASFPFTSVSWTLYTQEFYRGIRQHLTARGVFLQRLPIDKLTINDYRSILRTFQSVFPNTTLWYTGGTQTLLLATPDPLTEAALIEKLNAVATDPTVQLDLGDETAIRQYDVMTSDQVRQFSSLGHVVLDNTAFFMPENSETEALLQLIQPAADNAGSAVTP